MEDARGTSTYHSKSQNFSLLTRILLGNQYFLRVSDRSGVPVARFQGDITRTLKFSPLVLASELCTMVRVDNLWHIK